MKKYLFLILAVFLFPVVVHAEEYSIRDFYYYDGYDGIPIVIREGDEITFPSNSSDEYHIIIDGEAVTGVFNHESGNYVVPKDIYYQGSRSRYEGHYIFDEFFGTYSDDFEIVDCDPDVEFQTFGPNTILHLGELFAYLYDEDENLIISNGWNMRFYSVPEGKIINVEVLDDGLYGNPAAHIYPIPYVGPEFKLTCADKSIRYGSKTKCSITATYLHPLKKVFFDLNIPNFKISDVTLPDGISSINGTKQYNLKIGDTDENEVTLLNFYLEGIKNENYIDDITIINVNYQDDVYEGEYNEIKGDLNIIPTVIKNPLTGRNLYFILLPMALLLTVLGSWKLTKKKI